MSLYFASLYFILKAKQAEARGDIKGANSKGRTALILNIVATVVWIVISVILVIVVPTAIISSRRRLHNSYTSYYTLYDPDEYYDTYDPYDYYYPYDSYDDYDYYY